MFLRTLRAAAVRRGRKGLSDGATPEVSPEGVRERARQTSGSESRQEERRGAGCV